MSQITCTCGNTYDSGFKFCPECAAPNPVYVKKATEADTAAKPVKKRFTKVGESNLSKEPSEQKQTTPSPAPAPAAKMVAPKKTYTVARPAPETAKPAQKPVPQPQEIYDDYEDEEDETPQEQVAENYDNYDYEDEVSDGEETYSADEEDNEDYNDYEDEVEDEDDEETPAPAVKPSLPFKSKGKVLTAPTVRPNRNVASNNVAQMPKTKKVAQTKSSLGKNKPEYDPNHDGYYDDRLPAILDEVTKTSHLDVILKISLSAVCIAALITYCIFYVQV